MKAKTILVLISSYADVAVTAAWKNKRYYGCHGSAGAGLADRPGVMTASAARGYLNRYAVLPGERVVVATNNDSTAVS